MRRRRRAPKPKQPDLKQMIEIIQMNRENVYLLYEAVEGLVFLVDQMMPVVPKELRQKAKLSAAYAKKALKHVRLKRDEFMRQRSKIFSGRLKR